jgi:hypothetical protein
VEEPFSNEQRHTFVFVLRLFSHRVGVLRNTSPVACHVLARTPGQPTPSVGVCLVSGFLHFNLYCNSARELPPSGGRGEALIGTLVGSLKCRTVTDQAACPAVVRRGARIMAMFPTSKVCRAMVGKLVCWGEAMTMSVCPSTSAVHPCGL